jgi:hypothetical protein
MHKKIDVIALRTERLEDRCFLSATLSTAPLSPLETNDAMQAPIIAYAGVSQGVDYFPHPSATLYSPIEDVSVSAASSSGTAPTGTVTFYLNGVLAGYGSLYSTGFASFQANPGTYTLTAQYSGDQVYSPVDLPATIISIPESATGPSPIASPGSGVLITSSTFPVSEISGTSFVASGAPLQDYFDVAFYNPASHPFNSSFYADVIAVSIDDPQNQYFVQRGLIIPFRDPPHHVDEVPFSLDVENIDLSIGSYVLEYEVSGNGGFSNIYSTKTIVVSDAVGQAGTHIQVGKAKGLPSSLVSGTPVRGSAVVTVTNSDTAPVQGTDTIALYASSTGTIDASSTLLGSVRRSLSLKAGKSASVAVPIRTFASAAGGYTVLARVTDAAGTTADATAGPVVDVLSPIAQVAGTIARVSPAAVTVGRTLSFTLTLTNSGNADSTGTASLAVALSADGVTPTIPVEGITKVLTLKPGKPVSLRLAIKVPVAAATLTLFPLVVVTQGDETVTAAATTAVKFG